MASVNSNYLLAVESAISGGSIALFRGNDFVSGASGESSVSRAEDLLPRIIDLLDEAGVGRNQVNRIAVSLGPGSYTGLRIGIATVMGLCRGLEIDYVGVPVFDAVAFEYKKQYSSIVLPMGKSDICVSDGESGGPRVTSLEALKAEFERADATTILAHSNLIPALIERYPDIVDIGTNLAKFIGSAALDRPPSSTLEPIYIQNPRFG